jgi:phosphoserine phosphatase
MARLNTSELEIEKLHTAPSLTAHEFAQSVLELNPRVAVFDCDGTLWSGDAGSGFMNWTMESGLLSRTTSDWMDARYRSYLRGEVDEYTICAEMVQIYKGLSELEVRAAAREYFRLHIEKNIFPELSALIDALRTHGTEIWAVSSTNNWVVEEGVSRFGIFPENIIAASVKVARCIVTGEILNVPTGEGKAESLRRAGLPAPDAAFGNSVHDAAMLAMARRAYAVNPSEALLQLATKSGWNVYHPITTVAR